MYTEILDTRGMKCPQPILRIAVKAADMKPGDILKIRGDCTCFENDVRVWCKRIGKVVLSVKDEDHNAKGIQIQF